MNPVNILIKKGDIFSSDADALVVPGNVQPDLGWGSHIAERVNKMASSEVKRERESFGDLPLGEACLTNGSETGFKYLIHASVLNKYDFNPLFLLHLKQRTSDLTLTNAMNRVNEIARENRIKSVAISAMGAGIGGMNYFKCCSIIFNALIDSPCSWHFYAYRLRHLNVANKALAIQLSHRKTNI